MKPNSSLRKNITVSLDPLLVTFIKSKPNYSRYVEALVKQDMQLQATEPIYEAITQKMLKDDTYLAILAKRLQTAGPVVQKVDRDVTIVQGDWGA